MPVIGTALAVQERYKADAADPLAAAIAFFAFLSLFPLLLLAVSVAGFVLDDPADQIAVAERITDAIPGFDQTVEGEDESQVEALLASVVAQRGTVGAVGLVILLFSGLRVVNAAMVATRVVFRGAVLKGVGAKLRQVLALFGLGGLFLLSAAASSLAGTGLGQLPASLALLLSVSFSFVLDVGLFLGAYTLLSPTAQLGLKDRLPGALLAGAGWTALKVAGASWVGNQIESANALYGALGSVIALMLLFYLAGRLYLYGAQLTAVRYERVHGPLIAPHEAEALGLTTDAGSTPQAGRDGAGEAWRDAPALQPPAAPEEDGPPPVPRAAQLARPTDPGPGGRSAAISPATQARLGSVGGAGGTGAAGGPAATSALSPAEGGEGAADGGKGAGDGRAGEADGRAGAGDGRAGAEDDRGRDVRAAVSFALAAGALAAGWRLLGDRER